MNPNVTQIGMTLTEANALLAEVGYNPKWSDDQLITAFSGFSPARVRAIGDALRICGAAAIAEANALAALHDHVTAEGAGARP